MNEFSWPVRVYYEDTDAGGVVFYANYLKFFERARSELLRSLGFEQDNLLTEENLIFVVRSVNVDYLKPARFNQLLTVSAKIIACQKTNLTFEQWISCGKEQLCRGVIRIVCLDAQKMKPKLIPLPLLEKLT